MGLEAYSKTNYELIPPGVRQGLERALDDQQQQALRRKVESGSLPQTEVTRLYAVFFEQPGELAAALLGTVDD